MIHDASTFGRPVHIEADLCVVGSGPGGATAATLAAEAGMRVVMLESGGFVPPSAMTQREEQMIPKLLWANGGRTTSDRGIHLHHGRAVGGSSVHNLNLCKRIPDPILRDWRKKRGLKHLPQVRWDELYSETEAMLSVSAVPQARWNRNNQLLAQGTHALGWRGGGLSHNRSGCIGAGFCELGCAYDAKNNVPRVLLPRFVAAGGRVICNAAGIVVRHQGGEVSGVEAAALDPITHAKLHRITVSASQVMLAGSALGTPAVLLRSDVPDPGGETGKSLRIHPALVAAGEFSEPVNAWRGIPQTFECTPHLNLEAAHGGSEADKTGDRTWIVPAFAHPVGTATMMPGHGAAHRALMNRYDHIAVFTAMIHDRTRGVVRPSGDLEFSVDYWSGPEDRAELTFGLARCVQLLFAAGATRVHVPTDPVLTLSPSDSLEPVVALDLQPGRMDITAVHPMGSVPMGDDSAQAAVDSQGRHHHLEGLWVCDGSLFPTSIGGPPQLSIYALGLHIGRALIASRGS